jgi:hypothetical protein
MITVTDEELEEFPEVELPEVDFDTEQVQDLIDVSQATREAQDLQPFNQAAGWKLQKMAKELKKQVDDAAAEYKKQVEEREAKILAKREEKRKAEEEEQKEEAERQRPETGPRDTLAYPTERRV